MKIAKKVKKFRRHHNSNQIKIRQSYSTYEIAELLGIHLQTVISWYKAGLKRIDNLLPSIVFGQDLINFINDKNNRHKHKCADDELFCCKCKHSRRASENKVIIKIFKGRVNLMGNCEKCGTKIFKTISTEKVELYKKIFVVITEHEKDLIECNHASSTTSKNEKERND